MPEQPKIEWKINTIESLCLANDNMKESDNIGSIYFTCLKCRALCRLLVDGNHWYWVHDKQKPAYHNYTSRETLRQRNISRNQNDTLRWNTPHGCRSTYISVMIINTVKPVCNDHLYNKIYYLWFIQQCVLMKTESTNLLLLTLSAFWSSSRWPLAT